MQKLDEALGYIRENQQRLDAIAQEQRAKASFPVHPLQRIGVNISVAAVDSGFLASRMHGVDLVVARTAAVNFVYRNSKLAMTSYFPSQSPHPVLDVQIGLEENEANQLKQLFRLEQEIGLAIATMQEFKPAMLLVDGSLLPLPGDRSTEESVLYGRYGQLLARYAQLYETARALHVQLVGVVKDTRSKLFVNGLKQNAMSDALFFHRYLQAGERVESLPHAKQENGATKSIRVFYMKAAEQDIPLRIEYLDGETASRKTDIGHLTQIQGSTDRSRSHSNAIHLKDAEQQEQEIADTLYTISAPSKVHGYPAPLIEADLRAMLDPRELERLERTFRMHLPELQALRRNARPFR